jgi:Exo70 exocyst complex subunit
VPPADGTSIDGTSWFEFDPEYALDVVLQWDPFNSMSCIGHAEVSVWIFSLGESAGSLGINGLQNYEKAVTQIASSRLNDIFDCLINANAAFHNVEVIQAYSYARHPSRYFCASGSVTSSSGGRNNSCLSSVSPFHSTSLSSHPIDIPASKIHPKRSTCEIEPTYEKEKASDGRIIYRFSEAISNLKQLADKLVCKNCGHVLSKAFRKAFQATMEQKLVLLGFHHGAKEMLEKLGSTEASTLRERRRDWERAFKVIVYELLPWPKFLCDEIFPDNTNELKEACFYEYAKLCLKPLLEFADASCSILSNQAERISHQLHVHEVLSELSANVFVVLQESEPTQLSLAEELVAVIKRLEKAILKALADFRSQLQHDKSCIKQNEVGVHHLTRSTMSYVKVLSRHRITINSILYDGFPFSNRKSLFLSDQSCYDSDVRINASNCHEFMLCLFSCLETKLVQKSQLLKSSVATRVFWINNLSYIIEQVANPQLRIILGEEWVQEQNDKIQGYLMSYEASVLEEVRSCLVTLRGSGKKKLISFKLSIEEMCKAGASWKVPNPILRDALRKAALDAVVSVYTDFLRKLHPGMLENNFLAISIEEELEGLKSHILDLFEG